MKFVENPTKTNMEVSVMDVVTYFVRIVAMIWNEMTLLVLLITYGRINGFFVTKLNWVLGCLLETSRQRRHEKMVQRRFRKYLQRQASRTVNREH